MSNITNKKNILISLIIFTLFLITLLNPNILITCVLESTNLFINKLFTSLFPFFIISELLLNYNFHIYVSNILKKTFTNLFNISEISSSIIILSMLTGNPSNAKYIKDYLDNNLITLDEANKLLTFTYFPSPAFVINFIGYTIFNNINLGILLLLLIYIYNFILGIYLKNKIKINKLNFKNKINVPKSINKILKNSITNSFNTLMIILGNIILFSILFNILKKYIHLNPYLFTLLSSILELTSGIENINLLNTNIIIKISLILFSLLFSGLSIYSQTSSILSDYKINIKKIIRCRLIFSILFTLITFILLKLIHLLH